VGVAKVSGVRVRKAWMGLLLGLLSLWPVLGAAQQPLLVRHNLTAQQNDRTLAYEEEVLRLVLDKTVARHGPYKLVRVAGISQKRAFAELEIGGLDLVSSMTSVAREAATQPVRYCIYKGLLGVRVGMGSAEAVARLEGLRSRDELSRVPLGAVFDWPDLQVQKEAGLAVVSLSDFASGLKRLRLGSFELLPLGIVEAPPIAANAGLSLIESWVLAYPSAYYFFVRRGNDALARRLSDGFEIALHDGSFERLFERRIGPQVKAANLATRRVFRLRNPILPEATPTTRRELWHPFALKMFEGAPP